MGADGSWTLSEVARLVGQPQHRLIHLCEKGVVRADFEEARGRGSSRRFSRRNLLHFAVALKLRELMVPVAPIGAVVHVLGAFEKVLAREMPGFKLPESLAESGTPELRVIITDRRILFFALHPKRGAPRVFGGIDLDALVAEGSVVTGRVSRRLKPGKKPGQGAPEAVFGPGTESEGGRIEVSVTRLARGIPRSPA
ncbi:MAG: hypothetical protein IH939_04870 [Acidobacteria bacterium]|nr:hypothetical protein [Acidobacteriota bacterium]